MRDPIESLTDRYLRDEEAETERVEAYERYFDAVRQAQLAQEIARAVVLGGNIPRTPDDHHLVESLTRTLQPWVVNTLFLHTPALADLAAEYEVGLSWAEWTEPPEREYERNDVDY